MDSKTKIIVDEIKHWRKNKLLPQQYCDFLLVLYLKGSDEEAAFPEQTSKGRKLSPFLMRIVRIVLSVSAFLVFYFSLFYVQMQIPFGIILFLICGTGFFLGLKYKDFFFQCLSLFYTIIFASWYSKPYLEETLTLKMLEGSWIALGLLVIGLAWFIRNVNPILCVTLYVNGVVLLFIPSFQALLMADPDMQVIQTLLWIKSACAGVLLFVWRPFKAIFS